MKSKSKVALLEVKTEMSNEEVRQFLIDAVDRMAVDGEREIRLAQNPHVQDVQGGEGGE